MASTMFKLLVASYLVSSLHGYTMPDLEALVTQLFTTNNYKKESRPFIDNTAPTTVYMSLFLTAIQVSTGRT